MIKKIAPVRTKINLKDLNGPIEIVPYNQTWTRLFEQEAQKIRNIFSANRLVYIEHYGSTSVPGLSAKPIIDILVGLETCALSQEEIAALCALDYQYFGKARTYERLFLRKTTEQGFHIAIVLYAGAVWRESLTIRDFLRTHDDVAKAYEQVKYQAIKEECDTFLSYANYKHDFILDLVEKAYAWSSEQ